MFGIAVGNIKSASLFNREGTWVPYQLPRHFRTFLLGATLAPLLVLTGLSLKISRLPELTAPPAKVSTFRLAGTVPHDRRSFLQEVLREHEREVALHSHFITQIISAARTKLKNPSELAHAVVMESLASGVDPLFVLSIIREESIYNSRARSSKGALGLMQLLPSTGKHIAKKVSHGWHGEQRLEDPRYNIRLGISYFKYLEGRFKGDIERALVAYNWGPTKLSTALKRKQRIPTVSIQYARSIMKRYEQWSEDFALLYPAQSGLHTQRQELQSDLRLALAQRDYLITLK